MTDDGREQGLELALLLMQRNATDAQWTTNALVESFQNSTQKAEATLRAVRAQVEELCSGPYAPSTAALMRALWPSEATVEYYTDQPDHGPAIAVHAWEGSQYGGVG
jgi:hypothetical protein